MKKVFLLFAVSLIVSSCDEPIVGVEEYADWVRLSIPNGREAFAIAGDIEETLLVATWTKAFYTSDKGQTWVESKDFQGPVRGFLQRQDTVVALFSEHTNEDGTRGASTGYLYTLDLGRTWKYEESGKYLTASAPIGTAESAWGIKYRIKNNQTPVENTQGVFLVNPSTIEKWPHLDNDWMALEFPIKVKANNLHLDRKNRLYIAASSGSFNEANSLQVPDEKSPAWIFISKRVLPQ
jgi:hypothetical protein